MCSLDFSSHLLKSFSAVSILIRTVFTFEFLCPLPEFDFFLPALDILVSLSLSSFISGECHGDLFSLCFYFFFLLRVVRVPGPFFRSCKGVWSAVFVNEIHKNQKDIDGGVVIPVKDSVSFMYLDMIRNEALIFSVLKSAVPSMATKAILTRALEIVVDFLSGIALFVCFSSGT